MKSFRYIALILFTAIGYVHGQTSITLNFTATQSGVHASLDSIYVTNLTRGGDTMLYGNDTVLLLDHGIGISHAGIIPSEGLTLHPAFPNPFSGMTTVRFFLAKQDIVDLRIYDLMGRVRARFSGSLQPGDHSFTLQSGQEELYFVSVKTPQIQKAQKLISVGRNSGACILEYSGWQPATTMQKLGKSAFTWQPGDSLRYFGFALMNGVAGHSIIEDDPANSTQYSFDLMIGLPCLESPFVTDINGNIYMTVQIGTQCWMRENLKASSYNDGVPIPIVTGDNAWANQTSGARCWYNNDSSAYAAAYGEMYNWYAVNSGKLCPTGWHVPTDAEWTTLTDFAGGTSVAGNKLKSTRTEPAPHPRWNSPNNGATNEFGFSALPGGYRDYYYGTFDNIGYGGHWWSSTAESAARAYRLELYSITGGSFRGNDDYKNAFTVRCVKD